MNHHFFLLLILADFSSVLVSTLINDITIAVIFNIIAVEDTLFIRTIQTRTVLTDFYRPAVFLALLEMSLELFAVTLQDSFAIHLVVFPTAHVGITIFPFVGAFSFALVVLPFSHIDCYTLPGEGTIAALFAIDEASFVLVTIGKGKDALTHSFAINIVTFIDIAIAEFVRYLCHVACHPSTDRYTGRHRHRYRYLLHFACCPATRPHNGSRHSSRRPRDHSSYHSATHRYNRHPSCIYRYPYHF
ncbi:membrane protein [gut metagenome]|uniref:Membrane protein n=1 Tax=gut metagenome TaxID=749906 RepID=J9D795_9ZZZZ